MSLGVQAVPSTRSQATRSWHSDHWHTHHVPTLGLSLPREAGWRQGRVTNQLRTGVRFSSWSLVFQGEKYKMRSRSHANNHPPVRGQVLSFPWAKLPAWDRDAQGLGTEGETPFPAPTLPTARPRCTLTLSSPIPCMAQREAGPKRERDSGCPWGTYCALSWTMCAVCQRWWEAGEWKDETKLPAMPRVQLRWSGSEEATCYINTSRTCSDRGERQPHPCPIAPFLTLHIYKTVPWR